LTAWAGFLVLVVAAIPGYIYIRCAERRAPRQSRSGVLLAAELGFVGVLTTTVAALVLIEVARRTGWLDPGRLIATPRIYLAAEPERVTVGVLATLLLSFGLAWIASVAVHRGVPASLRPGFSVWHQVLGRTRDSEVVATIELRDGRRFQGVVRAYDIEDDRERRGIALQYPIFAIDPMSGAPTSLGIHYLLFESTDIAWIGVTYKPAPARFPEIGPRADEARPRPAVVA
jgi:hypothetical protein